MQQVELLFPQIRKTVTVPVGTSLSQVCQENGLLLDLVCGGTGTCGKCRVMVRREEELDSVLACQTTVTTSMEVLVPPESLAFATTILAEGDGLGMHHPLVFQPRLKKVLFEKGSVSASHGARDFVFNQIQIMAGCELKAGYNEMKLLDGLLSDASLDRLTLVMVEDEMIDLQPGDTTGLLYGAAVDIGTTTLAMYFFDMVSGRQLMLCSDLNPQRSWGADVISRIEHCRQEPEGTRDLQRALIDALNRMIQKAEDTVPGLKEHLFQLTVCGNTTMQHLFHGFYPGGLGESPYRGLYQDMLLTTADGLGLHCAPAARVYFLPVVGGFVGADTVAVLLSIKPDERKRLVIDLGTNGEIAVGSGKHYLAASTACGPALEGAGIQFGMRAAPGAVEGYALSDGKPVAKIIGGGKASGLCGSGVVDVVAVLLKARAVEVTGRLMDRAAFEARYPGNPLAENLVMKGPTRAFQVVAPEDTITGEGVYLTQKDIRQIQLAKSAIFTGCMMLIKKAGLQGSDLQEILLSGAFGNYIHIGNAQLIGMVPYFEGVPVRSIGNGAGTGVQRVLLNQKELDRSREISAGITHVDLASEPEFQQSYLLSLNFLLQHDGGNYESGI